MNKFKRLLPRYADMRIQGAVAGMVVDEDAIEAAQSAGRWYWGVTRHACLAALRERLPRNLGNVAPPPVERLQWLGPDERVKVRVDTR